MRNKWVWAALCLVLGGLQAWDSGVLRAAWEIQALVGLAILVPVVTLLATESYGARAAAVAMAFVLLTVARIMSSVALPTLIIVAFVPAVLIFFSKMTELGAQPRAGGVKG